MIENSLLIVKLYCVYRSIIKTHEVRLTALELMLSLQDFLVPLADKLYHSAKSKVGLSLPRLPFYPIIPMFRVLSQGDIK